MNTQPFTIAILGDGMIAGEIRRLAADRPCLEVIGSFDRRAIADAGGLDATLPQIASADLVVEAATQDAVAAYGPSIVASGTPLLVLSLGALADAGARARLQAGPGRLLLSTGAIGGIDHLRAMRLVADFDEVRFESRKRPSSLVQKWMDADTVAQLEAATEPVVLMEDRPARVAQAFPASANVAAAVALATDGWDIASARIVADPDASLTTHRIYARNTAGECQFEVKNEPSPARPRSSLIVAYSVLRAIADLAGQPVLSDSPTTTFT